MDPPKASTSDNTILVFSVSNHHQFSNVSYLFICFSSLRKHTNGLQSATTCVVVCKDKGQNIGDGHSIYVGCKILTTFGDLFLRKSVSILLCFFVSVGKIGIRN